VHEAALHQIIAQLHEIDQSIVFDRAGSCHSISFLIIASLRCICITIVVFGMLRKRCKFAMSMVKSNA